MSSTDPRARRVGLRRMFATFGALVAGTALAFGSATPAAAAQNDIDLGASGSITVHKFAEPTTPTNLPNDGTAADTSGLTPLAGVSFSVQQVNVDMTNSTAWEDAQDLTVAQAQAKLTGTATTAVTDAQGTAPFEGLAVGLYLVTETDAGDNGVTFKGEPFLVSIPQAQNNSWLYDVNVYPKNTVTTLDKTVDDSAAHVIGDTVSYTLTGQVPSLPAASPLQAYGITDTLDSRLAYKNATVTVTGVDLTAPADYALGADGQDFSVVFSDTGLAKLRVAQGAAVTVKLNTTVNSLGDGAIQNTASVYINDPSNTIDSDTVTTAWGAIKVLKHAAGDQTATLSGAQFQLFALNDEGEPEGDALENVAVGGTTFTTGDEGTFQVDGVKAGDYQLVETKAPLGYQLDSTPVKVTVTEGSLAEAEVTSIANEQVPAFQLPLTGSTGIGLFVGLGVVLVAAGLGLAAVRNRRSRA